MAQIVKRLSEGSETWNLDGTCENAEIQFFIINPTSKADAIGAVQESAPRTYGGLSLSKIRFDGADSDGNFTVVAVYESDDSSDSGSDGSESEDPPVVNFDCGAGTKHVSVPISQVCVYSADNNAESGAIASAIPVGWNGKTGAESEVAGVDIPIGELRETYTKTLSISKVTGATWKKNIASLVDFAKDDVRC